MIVQPKVTHVLAQDTIREQPGPDFPGDLFIECEVVQPPSRAGRTVYVHVPARQVPAVLKAARDAAIRIRVTPEGAS